MGVLILIYGSYDFILQFLKVKLFVSFIYQSVGSKKAHNKNS